MRDGRVGAAGAVVGEPRVSGWVAGLLAVVVTLGGGAGVTWLAWPDHGAARPGVCGEGVIGR